MEDFFQVVSLEEAKKIFNDINIKNKLKKEFVELENSLGRTLAENIFAERDIPNFNRSSVDGYGIKVEDSFGASENNPSLVSIIGSVEMGKNYDLILKNGEAIYIPTGGFVPEGVTGIIMIENVETLGEKELLLQKSISAQSNIISKGSEISKNTLVISENTKINSSHISVVASLGRKKVEVYEKIKFYIISTGDEVKNLGEDLEIGEVFDVNSFALESLIRENFGEVVKKVLVKDNMKLLEQEIKNGVETSDIILISGGSSVGIKDFTKDAIEKNGGEILIHGISVKPGKPTIIAKTSENKIILGLPGHPHSAIRIFSELTQNIFQKEPKFIFCKCSENISGESGKTFFVNVKFETNLETKEIYAKPIFGKSGMIGTFLECDGYIIIPPEREGIYKDEVVKVFYK